MNCWHVILSNIVMFCDVEYIGEGWGEKDPIG
jgi:hypothetical protein